MRKTKRERKKEIRRELIIDSAVEVIRRNGFEQATMNEIAREADLGKGTLYLYFRNKADIYLAINERGSGLLNQQLREIILQNKSGIEILDELGNAYLRFIKKNPVFFMAASYYENLLKNNILTESSLTKECEKHAKEAMTYIVRSLQIGIQDGSIRNSHDPYKLGLIIWSASRGVVHAAHQSEILKSAEHSGSEEMDYASLLGIFIDVLRSGIKNDQ